MPYQSVFRAGLFAGQTVIVTGGGSGIGLGSAIRLAADGAHVTICGRTEDKLVAAVEQISAAAGEGGSVRHIVADVTVEDQIAAAIQFAAEPTGGLGILFANAGGSFHMGPFPEADAEALRASNSPLRSFTSPSDSNIPAT